ncbi:MAG: flagellar biosynthesis anti-sigma factor FlgM [Gammaproteobacteria bacterium]|nr:flagellar biosynthesis anti-sigma factor FlgM [Gammaproteobacteria bacterium]
MRIKGTDSGPVDSGGTRAVERVRHSTPVGSGTTPAASGADSVRITDSARQLSGLEQAVRAAPDVDTQRVATLQQSIERGQYRADAGRIADRLLQLESDIAASGKQA